MKKPQLQHASERGFALPELGAAAAIALVGLCLLMIMGSHSRRHARIGEDLSHLRTIGAGTASYGSDFGDRMWGLNWTAGPLNTPYPDLNFGQNDMDAATKQFVYLVRVRGGRTPGETPVPFNMYPYLQYQHVVLADYLDLPLPARLFVSAGDFRWNWANDPKGYEQGLYLPNYGTSWRIPHQPSFRVGIGFHDVSNVGQRAYPSTYSSTFVPGGNTVRQKLLTGVKHPTQKVLLHDAYAWHFRRPLWHMQPEARAPAVMVDGSASVRAFVEANRGANPNTPGGASLQVQYNPPFSWEPGYPGGMYWAGPLWTRMSIEGRDFGGPEVFP